MSALKILVDGAVNAVLNKFAHIHLLPEEIAVSLAVLDGDGASTSAHHRGGEPIYPASVIKLFYLVAAHRWMEDGAIADTAELRRALRDMIVDSGNEATGYVVDVLTDTTSGPELSDAELERWHDKRNAVNRYFHGLGYVDVNANRKTWHDGPYGRDKQAVDRFVPARNSLTTNSTARLLMEIANGRCVSELRSRQMMELMARDFTNSASQDCQAREFFGPGIPVSAKLWSKAGYMSKARHDAAIVQLAGARKFVLVVFTTRPDNKEIIPEVARQIVAGL